MRKEKKKRKADEEARQKLHENLGLEDYFERPLKTLSLVVHI